MINTAFSPSSYSNLSSTQFHKTRVEFADTQTVKVGDEIMDKDTYMQRQLSLLGSAYRILQNQAEGMTFKGSVALEQGGNYYVASSLVPTNFHNVKSFWGGEPSKSEQDIVNLRKNITLEKDNGDIPITFSSEYYGLLGSFDKGYFKGDRPNTVLSQGGANLTAYALENTLKTPYGDVSVFLDLYNDNDKLGIGNLTSNALLFNFDSNGDGFLNGEDKLFSKLKVRGYDKDGNEKIANLSDVKPQIDLKQFIKKEIDGYTPKKWIEDYHQKTLIQPKELESIDNRMLYYSANPYTTFSPESRYEKLENEKIKEFFNVHADKDGWVDLRGNHIFNENSLFNNFAYEKVGFDGKIKLSEFNPIIEPDPNKQDNKTFSYTSYQRDSFMKFYNDYHKEFDAHTKDIEWLSENLKLYKVTDADEYISKLANSKSSYMIAMENEFEKATGLEFSMANLHKVKSSFELNSSKAAAMLNDSDSVVAMKLNQNGTITLKFDSGRELEVNELYSDTGKLLEDSQGRRVSINLEAKTMPEVELNKLNFETLAIDDGSKYKTLKEIGTNYIKQVATKHGIQFLLYLEGGTTRSATQLYNLYFLDNMLNPNKIRDEDRFYKKVDVVA